MKVSELKNSRYLAQLDVEPSITVTIKDVQLENVSPTGKEEKWVLYFDELDKGLVLNYTRGDQIARALNSQESVDWRGKQIVLYWDPDVRFGNQITGGIRCRAVQPAMAGRGHAEELDVPF